MSFYDFLNAMGYLLVLGAGIGGLAMLGVLLLNIFQHRRWAQRILRHL